MNFTALGIASLNNKKEILEVFYNWISTKEEVFSKTAKQYSKKGNFQVRLDTNNKEVAINDGFIPNLGFKSLFKNQAFIVVGLSDDKPIETVPEAYLKLHLISKRIVKPGQLNLDNLFNILPNVAWTNKGVFDLNEIDALQIQYRCRGDILHIKSVDKFPLMTDYTVPTKTRIANTAQVRLGAYLGEGTTVMHAGFINFNAGTEGPNMVEGRISAGVFVGSGSDLGGGCSIMGTLSGGNKKVISIGKNCLVGANAGLGISLGDRCTIEAGLYLTAGAKVKILDEDKKEIALVKAISLDNKNDLLFRRNSTNGQIECLANKNTIELNKMLHKN